jgi:hypothetical protein
MGADSAEKAAVGVRVETAPLSAADPGSVETSSTTDNRRGRFGGGSMGFSLLGALALLGLRRRRGAYGSGGLTSRPSSKQSEAGESRLSLA